MKKLLALVLVICSVFSLASCSLFTPKPPKDLEKVAKDLEDSDDYYAIWSDDEDDMDHPGMVEYLYVRGEDSSLSVVVFDSRKAAKLYYESLKIYREYQIDSLENEIDQIEYTLKHYEDDLDSDVIDEYEDDLKELKKELEELKKETVIGKSGKRVWSGSKDLIKDIK